MQKSKEIRTPEEQAAIRSYMSHLGKKGGGRNKQKGADYFRWVRSHRKPKDETPSETD